MQLPVIIKDCKCFDGGFTILSCELNPYSDSYSKDLETFIDPYINVKYDSFTVIANFLEIQNENLKGRAFVFIGDFYKHVKYGYQFKSEFHYDDVSLSEDGLIQTLSLLPNIKVSRAQSIVREFGVTKTIDILDNNVEALTSIKGITPQRLIPIQERWKEIRALKKLYSFFVSNNFSSVFAKECYKVWGDSALDLIYKNPYLLCELKGVTFFQADELAHKILRNIDENLRLDSCIKSVIKDFMSANGSLCIPYTLLKKNVSTYLTNCSYKLNINSNIDSYLSKVPVLIKGNLNIYNVLYEDSSNSTYVYFKNIFEKENYITKSIFDRSSCLLKNNFTCQEKDIYFAEQEVSVFLNKKFELDEFQKKAIFSVFDNKLSVITGSGGTGKSMICRCIYNIAKSKGLSIKMMSPTGKSAQVLRQKTDCDATTIHRGLRIDKENSLPQNSIKENILLIDEASMCGVDTVYAIFKSIEKNKNVHVVLIGDKNQLPSVSYGNFLSDIIDSKVVPTVVLETIHRQSENNYIPILSKMISEGKTVLIPNNCIDIIWKDIDLNNLTKDIYILLDDFFIKNKSIDDVQFISPMKKGVYGVYKLNEIIQSYVAKRREKNDFLRRKNQKIYIGDRIIYIENNYEKMLFNGDIGVVVDYGEILLDEDINDKPEKYVTISFYGEQVTLYGSEIDSIQLAWCLTVHKFQGSQSKNIVFFMGSEAKCMMSKELIYTAFTRAEENLYIIGDKDMIKIGPLKSVIQKRYTNFNNIYATFIQKQSKVKVLK